MTKVVTSPFGQISRIEGHRVSSSMTAAGNVMSGCMKNLMKRCRPTPRGAAARHRERPHEIAAQDRLPRGSEIHGLKDSLAGLVAQTCGAVWSEVCAFADGAP